MSLPAIRMWSLHVGKPCLFVAAGRDDAPSVDGERSGYDLAGMAEA
jgi:hypothetical protein